MKRNRGFTFIECLLAIMIFGLMITSVYAVFRAVLSSEKKGAEISRDIRGIRWDVSDISREIRNIITHPVDYFEGDIDRIAFLTLLPIRGEDGMGDEQFCQIRYRFEKDRSTEGTKLVKTTLKLTTNEVDTLEIRDAIRDLAFSFERTDEKGDRIWVTSWEGQSGLPSAIGIEIMTGDSREPVEVTRFVQFIPIMTDREIGPGGK